ncbi:MAG: hypothetical protein ACLFTW_12930 [Chitinispirillaceae bacterium]
MMKTLLVLLVLTAGVFAEDVDISQKGKSVQVDGFLMEWNSENARRWENSDWSWDAMNTPEGVAGYFSSDTSEICSSWVFEIVPEGRDERFEIRIPEKIQGEFYVVDEARYDSSGRSTVEWLIPWSALGKEKTAGTYTVHMKAGSGCDDQLKPMILTGVREKEVKIITPQLISKGILIVLLLILYVKVRKFVKKAEARNR